MVRGYQQSLLFSEVVFFAQALLLLLVESVARHHGGRNVPIIGCAARGLCALEQCCVGNISVIRGKVYGMTEGRGIYCTDCSSSRCLLMTAT